MCCTCVVCSCESLRISQVGCLGLSPTTLKSSLSLSLSARRRDETQAALPIRMATKPSKLRPSDLTAADDWGSAELKKIVEQLIAYKAPINFLGMDDDDDGDHGEAGAGGVSSSYGIPEDTAKAIHKLPSDLGKKKAAVLICLFHDEIGDLRVLLTRRAKSLSSHSGEVALPGGKRDAGDANDAETALREAQEEIGLDSSIVRVVTYLEPFLSKHMLRVTPVVAVLLDKSKVCLTPNSGEVDAVFSSPLEMFLKKKDHYSEEREWLGFSYQIHYFNYEADGEKYLIWGLTAAILIRCASIIYSRPPEFGLSPEFVPITNHVPT